MEKLLDLILEAQALWKRALDGDEQAFYDLQVVLYELEEVVRYGEEGEKEG